jgi:hypothetical protein
MTNAWIIYKADSLSAPGWEDRALQPSGALTSILAEEHDYSGTLPTVGERVREYKADLQSAFRYDSVLPLRRW